MGEHTETLKNRITSMLSGASQGEPYEAPPEAEAAPPATPPEVAPAAEQKPRIPSDLTLRQYIVLKTVYFNRPYTAYGPERICPEIPYGTVRTILSALQEKGYIEQISRVSGGSRVQSTARMNMGRCRPLFGEPPIKNPALRDDQDLIDKYL